MSEQLGKNYEKSEGGILVPSSALVEPNEAEIDGYGNKPEYLSESNNGELIKDQMQREADEKAYQEILNPSNVIDLKQSIEVAQGRLGTKSENVNSGLNLNREKEAIRSKLIEKYLYTGDRDGNRTITDEVRQKLEEMLRQSYGSLEASMNSKKSDESNIEEDEDELPTNKIDIDTSDTDSEDSKKLEEDKEEDEILEAITKLRNDIYRLQIQLRELREGKIDNNDELTNQSLTAIDDRPTGVIRRAQVDRGRNNNRNGGNERQSNRRRNLLCALGGVAALGTAIAALWVNGLKDGTSKEKTITKTPTTKVETFDQRLSEHSRNQTIEKGFEKGMSADAARDLLIKQLGHRGEVLAVMNYAAENGISVDKARSHIAEIQGETKKVIGTEFDENGRLSLTSYGKEMHQRIANMLNNATVSWVDGDELQHLYNSGVSQGQLQNGRDDTLRINQNTGFDANVRVLKIELANGKVVYLKDNCANFLWKGGSVSLGKFTAKDGKTIKVTIKKEGSEAKMGGGPEVRPKEQIPKPVGPESTPTPTPTDPTPEKPPTGLTTKNPSEAPAGHDNGDHPAPAPELKPDTNADGVTGGTPSNPEPVPITPRSPENTPPVETNKETGQNANGDDGINDAPKNPSTSKPQQQNPNDV